MKSSVSSTTNKIKIGDNANVSLKLDGVNINTTSTNAIDIGQNSNINISFSNQNSLGGTDGIYLNSGAKVNFSGTGKLNITGTSNGVSGGSSVTFESGNVLVSGGSKDIDSTSVIIKGGSVDADATKINPPPTIDGTKPAYLYNFTTFTDIKSISVDGKTFSTSPDSGGLHIWMEGKNQIVKATDSLGVTKTYNMEFDAITKTFKVVHDYPSDLFTVTGDSSAYEFDEDTGILKIKKAGNFTISGGTKINELGNKVVGQIIIDSNITGNVKINLDNVDIDQSANNGKAAFEIGEKTKVDLTLTNSNVLKSGYHKAGLQVDKDVTLTIDGTGSLDAQGGYYGAGIGIGYESNSTNEDGGNIIINNGNIKANGGMGAAGIGGCYSRDFGDITINGGNIKASNKGHGAGIGGGWGSNSDNGKITITGGVIDASGIEHGTGIGAGCSGHSDVITITGGTIKAQGGDSGSGIGASWNGYCKDIIISGGDITATGGKYGSGIGAGENGDITDITISGGTIYAQGGTDGTGIGGGKNAIGGDINLTGGTITAIGGLTADGGNIGSYTDRTHNSPSKVNVGSVSIKAGTIGEGLYNTSGATDIAGEAVYSYILGIPADAANITSIKSKGETSGYENTWAPNTKHTPPNDDSAYIWMRGENQHVTIEYVDSTGVTKTKELDVVFYQESGMFRPVGEPAPPIPDKPNNPSDPDNQVPNPPTPNPPTPNPPIPNPPQPEPPQPEPPQPQPRPEYVDYILIKSGAKDECISIPRFYFSLRSLNLDKVDIATHEAFCQVLFWVIDAFFHVDA